MPMPKPGAGQSKENFIASFMTNETMKEEYPDEKQRLAIAYSQWKGAVSKSIYKDDPNDINITFDIAKYSQPDEGLVSGWANIAVQSDGSLPLDWDDDIILPSTLEKAAINFMLDYRESGVMHEGQSKGIVVESIVFTKDKQAAIGIPEKTVPEGWFITVKILDRDVCEQVKNGSLRMFSIQGKTKRKKL